MTKGRNGEREIEKEREISSCFQILNGAKEKKERERSKHGS